MKTKALRLDKGEPVSELVEILSRGMADQGLCYKKQLYEALGIAEYLVYGTGGQRADDSPDGMLVFRLEDGAYRQLECDPRMSEPETPAFFSAVFGTHIRMNAADWEVARFQWYAPVNGRWRDTETDREEQFRAEGAMEVAVAVPHKFLFLRAEPAQPKRSRVESLAGGWPATGRD